jgi:ABC-type taurine transport system ATPase subunit
MRSGCFHPLRYQQYVLKALRDVDLTLYQGDLLSVLGPSGPVYAGVSPG